MTLTPTQNSYDLAGRQLLRTTAQQLRLEDIENKRARRRMQQDLRDMLRRAKRCYYYAGKVAIKIAKADARRLISFDPDGLYGLLFGVVEPALSLYRTPF